MRILRIARFGFVFLIMLGVIIFILFINRKPEDNKNNNFDENFILKGHDFGSNEESWKYVDSIIENIRPVELQKYALNQHGYTAEYFVHGCPFKTSKEFLNYLKEEAYVFLIMELFSKDSIDEKAPVSKKFLKDNKLPLKKLYNFNVTTFGRKTGTKIFYVDEYKVLESYVPADGQMHEYDRFVLNKNTFEYELDKNGFIDNIILLNIEPIHDEDGNYIPKVNSKLMTKDYYQSVLINLCYGLDYVKIINNPNVIEFNFDEDAMTDSFKSNHDFNKSILDDDLLIYQANNRDKFYKLMINPKCCYKNENISDDEFWFYIEKCYKSRCLPVYIDFNNKLYFYDIYFEITDDLFLNSVNVEKKEVVDKL